MSTPEFDKYARKYNQVLEQAIPGSLSEEGYFAEYKIAIAARRYTGSVPLRILDFGCGAGRGLPYLQKYFPQSEIWGYDVSPESLAVALECAPLAILAQDWATIAAQRFDLIVAANVFHHIPRNERQFALSQCREVLADGGQMFLFEHNPYNPATRWVFERCPFDADAEMFSRRQSMRLAQSAGMRVIHNGYTLFFPRPLSFLRTLEPAMEWLPLGAQYYVQMAR